MSDLFVLLSVTIPLFTAMSYGFGSVLLYAIYSGIKTDEAEEAIRYAKFSWFIAKVAIITELIAIVSATITEVI